MRICRDIQFRILEPLFVTKEENSGLNLGAVKRFVQERAGQIQYRTNAWGGANFESSLPSAERSASLRNMQDEQFTANSRC